MFSIVISYYKQPDALRWQLDFYEKARVNDFELIVVVDGADDGQPVKMLRASSVSGRLVVVAEDVAWNLPGARNWGMVFARNDNCLRTDIDHRPTPELMEWLMLQRSLRGATHRFTRVNQQGHLMKPHGDSYFISKADYWEVGGYDENLSGAYGQNERDFLARAQSKLQVRQSNLALETRDDFKSDGGPRGTLINRSKLLILERRKNRRILHLRQRIKVYDF